MNALLPFVILGIAAGSVYGLTGTGLVLTYKTSGIFNFAQGAVATTGAYVFYILHDDVLHLPAVPTALICVFVVGPVLGLGLETMARRLADASATMKVVATIGLVLVVQGFFSAMFSTPTRTFPPCAAAGAGGKNAPACRTSPRRSPGPRVPGRSWRPPSWSPMRRPAGAPSSPAPGRAPARPRI